MKKVYVNKDVCIACGLCQVYCQVAHSKSRDIVKTFKKEVPRPAARLHIERNGEVSFSFQCRQCDEPLCVYSCLTGALRRDESTGMVEVDAEKCAGCYTCLLACPNGGLTRDIERGVVAKCDLCGGCEVPACVANCPNEALMYA
ncbi:MAG: 4Fe-4S dicluster domain-containing protein [Dehalococcoidia bacterium]|jgi:carbon-monoxide dehydrogenase iron sulfur subunit